MSAFPEVESGCCSSSCWPAVLTLSRERVGQAVHDLHVLVNLSIHNNAIDRRRGRNPTLPQGSGTHVDVGTMLAPYGYDTIVNSTSSGMTMALLIQMEELTMRNPLTLCAFIVSAFLAAGCEPDGAFENAGEEIDEATTDFRNAVEDTCEDVKDAVDAEEKNC
jgi:hypothetical protein